MWRHLLITSLRIPYVLIYYTKIIYIRCPRVKSPNFKYQFRIVKGTNFSPMLVNAFCKRYLLLLGLSNVCHRNNSDSLRILLKKIVVFIIKNNCNYYICCSKWLPSVWRQALISEIQIFQCYPFLTLNNFRS